MPEKSKAITNLANAIVDEKFGKALRFDWADDYVDCRNDASLILNQ